MAILTSCCCCRSLRTGSFACGIYTLVFYTIIVTACAFHVNTSLNALDILALSLVMLILSGLCVISSVVLLVGLCVDNRILLLPWTLSVAMATVLDLVISFYLFGEATQDPFLGVLLVIDYLITGLNVYCILCVVSQFQEYLAGRGVYHPSPEANLPVLHVQCPSQEESRGPSAGKSTFIPNGGLWHSEVVSYPSAKPSCVSGHRTSISSQRNDSQLTYQEEIKMSKLSRQETEELIDDVSPTEIAKSFSPVVCYDTADRPTEATRSHDDRPTDSVVCYDKYSADRLDSTSSTVLLLRSEKE